MAKITVRNKNDKIIARYKVGTKEEIKFEIHVCLESQPSND